MKSVKIILSDGTEHFIRTECRHEFEKQLMQLWMEEKISLAKKHFYLDLFLNRVSYMTQASQVVFEMTDVPEDE